jgi:hypothetical protein
MRVYGNLRKENIMKLHGIKMQNPIKINYESEVYAEVKVVAQLNDNNELDIIKIAIKDKDHIVNQIKDDLLSDINLQINSATNLS